MKLLKIILGLGFYYKIKNLVTNLYLKPVFFDIFYSEKEHSLCIIAPYYSRLGFKKTTCIFYVNDDKITSESIMIDDPDKNCLIVLFKLPKVTMGKVNYSIKKNQTEITKGSFRIENIILKYRFSIATLFKYETSYLKEWLDYHIKFGIEHFYLYENNITFSEKAKKILEPYIKKRIVTHILWPYPYVIYNYKLKRFWPNDSYSYTQLTQINHAIYKYNNETNWILCCDIDEYFYSPNQTRLSDIFNNKTKIKTSSISICGTWFGATTDDLSKVNNYGVLNTFKYSEREPNSRHKCFFDTQKVKMASVHNILIKNNDEVVLDSNILKFNHYRGIGWKKRIDPFYARDIKNTEIISELN